ncbi:periaxin isoform X1 [Anolis carolinensis]|uniref:periaxin isoform X1 n=2 Tax=Anolis carolinensis TaxID=28377 RepID=UPI002F2B546F
MCECFTRVFGVSWSPGASYAAEGLPPESNVFRTRQLSTVVEPKGNEQPTQVQTPTSSHPHQSPEEAADPERAAQKEKLHEELKRVLQRKGESQRNTEETVAGEEEEEEPPLLSLSPPSEMEAKVSAMEKTIETSELLEIIVETEAEAGVSGMSVAGGGRDGLFVKDVLKDSPAARALSLKEGDQLLSARVYFDNIKYEDALQILKCAEPYKISFCLKRTVPSADVSRKPGTSTFEVRGPKAKIAKLNIQSLSSLKKKKKKKVTKGLAKDLQETADLHGSRDLAGGKLEIAPVDVEFSLPKFSKLRKAKSAGEVAVAEPSPDVSPWLSSLETKRRKLKFPRLKVKEAAAAAAAGRTRVEVPESHLEVGLPKVAIGVKAATKKEGEGKVSRFTVPFTKAKKAKEEARSKIETGFQAPQVELDLPLPKAGPGRESPKTGAKAEDFKIQAPQIGLPKMEVVLPKVSTVGMEVLEGGLQAGLKLPTAEVAAPKIDVDLSFPKLEGSSPPEVVPKGEGFRIKVTKFGISAEDVKLKVPSAKAPVLEVSLEKDKVRSKDLAEKLTAGVTMPSLDVEAPSVELELPLPRGKAEMKAHKTRVEVPDIAVKVPSISFGKLVSKAPEEGESRLPQVEVSLGKPESPKIKAKGPKIQIPGFGISLAECRSDSKETVSKGAAESKVTFPGMKMPSLDISVPKVSDMQLPKAMGELAAPFDRAKSQEAAEEPGFRFQVPQVSLPKFDLPAKATPSPSLLTHTKFPKPEGDVSVKVGVPKVDLVLPDVQLPKSQCQKSELDISVEEPKVEMAVPSARLSFPSGTVPALGIGLPKVEVGLDLPKVERELVVSEPLPPRDHEMKLQFPNFGAVNKDLGVELSVPTCQPDQLEMEPSVRTFEGPDVSGMVARIPKVDLALGKELLTAEGERGLEIGLDLKEKILPKISLGQAGLAAGAKVKLPSVEIPTITIPDVTIESNKVLEAESKQKSPRFALPKFNISGPKAQKVSPEAKLKMPKFGISFPKSKWGAEVESPKLALSVEGKAPKEKSEPRVGLDSSESRMKLPTMEVEVPSMAVDISLPSGKTEEWPSKEAAGPSPEVGMDLPDVKLKMPKLLLPRFGAKGKEGDLELKGREAKLPEKEAKAKMPKFKMPYFSMMRRDVEISGLEAEAKIKKDSKSPKEKGPSVKMPSVKMPTLQLSSPKLETDQGKLQIQAPELGVKVPQVELPRISTKDGKAEGGLLMGSESPTFKVKMPSLEIAVPSPRVEEELEKPMVDVSEADIRGYEGELKIPSVPSICISAPKVELDIGLPTAGPDESISHGATSADAKIKLPKVELPKFGKGEDGGVVEAGVQLMGHKFSLGREGEKEPEGAAEGHILGSKVRMPKVDISLPKARLSDAELPLTEGEGVAEGTEGKFKMPSVGLPKFSTPKMKAPEVELDMSLEAAGKMPRVKVSSPAIKLPKFGGSSSDGEGEPEVDVPRVPQLELKAPKLRGSAEMLSLETGTKEAKIKMPSLPIGFGLGKAEAETGLGVDDGKFKLKFPSLSISKAGPESSTDTQPLCPPAEEADFSFKMPQIALPHVGFSVDYEGRKEAKEELGKLTGMTDLEVDVGGFEGRLKMPKIKMLAFGTPGAKGDTDVATASPPRHRRGSGEGDLDEKKAAFKVPGVEISAPSLKTHAEYDVEETQLRYAGSQELEGASKRGRIGSDGRKSPVGKGEGASADAGKKYKVKLPKFGLSLAKAGFEAEEGTPGQESETKAKKRMFALGRSKAKGSEGSPSLLEREEEGDGKGMMAKLKLKPSFGLSLSKPKLGVEVNGNLEEASSKLKVPKLGFSTTEESAQQNGEQAEVSLQDGSQESKGKMGKIRLPQVELSSPSKVAETDHELNLKLVRAEETKEDTHGSGGGTFSALKFKSPKITFSGFKKRNGEMEPGAVVSSAARTEMASLEMGEAGSKGERSPKFRFPKLALSPRSHGVLEITPEHPEDEARLKIRLPDVGFSGELSSEEPGLETRLGTAKVGTKSEGGAVSSV